MLNAAAVLPLDLRLTCVNKYTQPLSSQGESENEFTFSSYFCLKYSLQNNTSVVLIHWFILLPIQLSYQLI
mgnify:CR=1 FL=1